MPIYNLRLLKFPLPRLLYKILPLLLFLLKSNLREPCLQLKQIATSPKSINFSILMLINCRHWTLLVLSLMPLMINRIFLMESSKKYKCLSKSTLSSRLVTWFTLEKCIWMRLKTSCGTSWMTMLIFFPKIRNISINSSESTLIKSEEW